MENHDKKDFQPIVRIGGMEIPGELPVERALRKVKGLSHRLSSVIARILNSNKKVGELSEKEITELEDIIKNPQKYKIPKWMLNRQKDYRTGEDIHLSSFELDFGKREDITRLGRIKTYRGIRLQKGLTVRGQRTRSTGRKGGKLGVMKKSTVPAAKAAAPNKAAPAAKKERKKEAKK